MEKLYRIWYQCYDNKTGKRITNGVYKNGYKKFGNAVRIAEKVYSQTSQGSHFIYKIGQENPWLHECEICGCHFSVALDMHKKNPALKDQLTQSLPSAIFLRHRNQRNTGYIMYSYGDVCSKCVSGVQKYVEKRIKRKENKNGQQ